MNTKTLLMAAFAVAIGTTAVSASAQSMMHQGMMHQGMMHQGMKPKAGGKMVAYDAKDKRYYSVAYARAHGMHDKGGDPLSIVALSSLPKDAKESRAMHGAKM